MSDRHPCNPEYSDTPTFYTESGGYGYTYRTDVISAEDWLGHRFSVGETVMYCISAGRGQMMAIGVVQQIRARTYDQGFWTWEGEYPDRTRFYTKTGERTDVEVQILTSGTSGNYDNKARTRPAWVNPMNITALPEGFIQ